MKNAMKKLTSLLLVAVLLVGALPFAASAAGTCTVYVNVDGVKGSGISVEINAESGTANAGDLIHWKDEIKALASGTFCHAWVPGMGSSVGGAETTVSVGGEIHLSFYSDPSNCPKCNPVADNGDNNTQAGDNNTQAGDNNTQAGDNNTQAGDNNTQAGDNNTQAGDNNTQTQPTVKPIKIVVKADTSDNVVSPEGGLFKTPANGSYAEVDNLLTYVWNSDWDNKYTFDHAWTERTGSFNHPDGKIMAGEEVHIMLKSNAANNGSNTGSNNGTTTKPGYVVDEEFQHDIWLYIYTNNDLIQPSKRVLLNNYAIVDGSQDGGILTKNEILSVIDDYYKATDANKGIIWQGAYQEASLDVVKFIFKNDEAPFTGLAAARTAGTVVIKARVTGVKGISSAAADTSNPKTGDSIYTAMTVMGLSAVSLAAVMFFYNKKRYTV